jgi:hypothetical protein
MAISNSIALITKYSTKAWDKVYKAESLSSLLDGGNGFEVQWTGAKTVKIAKFSAGGLGNYYRTPTDSSATEFGPFGYPTSSVGLQWEEFTVSQDRSARYPIELFDNEETDGLVLGAATSELSRTVLIPEVDAYCFSTIAKTIENGGLGNYITTSIAAPTDNVTTDRAPYDALNSALVYLEEHEVPAEKQIIFVSPRFMNRLRASTFTSSRLLQSDISKDVKFTIQSYEGREIAVVPPERFRTHIDLSGKGVKWSEDSKYIDFLVVSKDAVAHVVKYNKIKIIGGDANLAGANFDGWSIFARIYHDVFIPDNKLIALYAHVSEDAAYASGATPTLSVVLVNGLVTKLAHFPADKKVSYVYAKADGNTTTAIPSKVNVLTIGTTLAAGSYIAYAVSDDTGAILAAKEITVA